MTTLTRYQERLEKKRAGDDAERECKRRVCTRDDYTCRACGRHTDPRAKGLLDKGHFHHVVFRSATRIALWVTGRVCLLCADCHDAVHHRSDDDRLWVTGDANVQLRFELGGKVWLN